MSACDTCLPIAMSLLAEASITFTELELFVYTGESHRNNLCRGPIRPATQKRRELMHAPCGVALVPGGMLADSWPPHHPSRHVHSLGTLINVSRTHGWIRATETMSAWVVDRANTWTLSLRGFPAREREVWRRSVASGPSIVLMVSWPPSQRALQDCWPSGRPSPPARHQ
jgi:hypothetical protein